MTNEKDQAEAGSVTWNITKAGVEDRHSIYSDSILDALEAASRRGSGVLLNRYVDNVNDASVEADLLFHVFSRWCAQVATYNSDWDCPRSVNVYLRTGEGRAAALQDSGRTAIGWSREGRRNKKKRSAARAVIHSARANSCAAARHACRFAAKADNRRADEVKAMQEATIMSLFNLVNDDVDLPRNFELDQDYCEAK